MLRPWPADDGALVRIRIVGGEITATELAALGTIADRYGDGDLHLTKRANLQLRGLPLAGDALEPEVADAILATGLVPSPAHELIRNVMVSPLTGLDGGVANLRPLAHELDTLLCADLVFASLPGRFLFVLDDGRGDLLSRPLDLGGVAVSASSVQLRAGAAWGPVVPIGEAAGALVELAHRFVAMRGTAWHVGELTHPLLEGVRDPRTEVASGPAPYGRFASYEHRAVPDGMLTAALRADVLAETSSFVVTPWHGLLLL